MELEASTISIQQTGRRFRSVNGPFEKEGGPDCGKFRCQLLLFPLFNDGKSTGRQQQLKDMSLTALALAVQTLIIDLEICSSEKYTGQDD